MPLRVLEPLVPLTLALPLLPPLLTLALLPLLPLELTPLLLLLLFLTLPLSLTLLLLPPPPPLLRDILHLDIEETKLSSAFRPAKCARDILEYDTMG